MPRVGRVGRKTPIHCGRARGDERELHGLGVCKRPSVPVAWQSRQSSQVAGERARARVVAIRSTVISRLTYRGHLSPTPSPLCSVLSVVSIIYCTECNSRFYPSRISTFAGPFAAAVHPVFARLSPFSPLGLLLERALHWRHGRFDGAAAVPGRAPPSALVLARLPRLLALLPHLHHPRRSPRPP